MIKKKRIDEAGVSVFLITCNNCLKDNTIFIALKENDTIGAKCGHCDNILWFNSRENEILKELDNPPFSNGENYTKWREEVIWRALSQLPACPKCNSKSYTSFVTNVPKCPLICVECGEEINEGKWQNVTKYFLNVEIDWIEEDE